MAKEYSLELENWGEDVYIVGTKGHHDLNDFKAAVLACDGYNSWPLGEPVHDWYKAVPNSDGGSTYVAGAQGKKGAFPVTVCFEDFISPFTK